MTRSELSSWIKAKALEIGFSNARLTTADPLDEAAEHLSEWLERGMHGYMQYMERNSEKRRDVREIMPEAKSILSLALNYYHPAQHDAEHLKISRYAWGTDYHEIIPPMLDRLLLAIKQQVPEAEGRSYVDTGPVLEKAIAERAGIGWIGKHTNVITRDLGSWVFLAEIILNLQLEVDSPATDLCGTCTRCIDACPTNAIVQPYSVDARKCISYLTIELKPEHPIAQECSTQMEQWLYGCDICQDVCPWNRFEKPSENPDFAPRQINESLTTEAIELMTQEEFSVHFKKSPIKRTKLAGLKRNAKVL